MKYVCRRQEEGSSGNPSALPVISFPGIENMTRVCSFLLCVTCHVYCPCPYGNSLMLDLMISPHYLEISLLCHYTLNSKLKFLQLQSDKSLS